MVASSVRDRVLGTVSRGEWAVLLAVVAVEVGLLLAYFAVTPSRLTSPRYALYPLVWITVGIWVALRTDLPAVSRRAWIAALAVAVAYCSALVVISGMVRPYGPAGPPVPTGVTVGMGSPGWAPRITVVTEAVHVVFVPYRAVGYGALTYLVYARLLDATRALASGAIGLLSCLGCAFPILSSLSTGLLGAGAGAAAVTRFSVDVSTAAFLLAVALLYWWPVPEG